MNLGLLIQASYVPVTRPLLYYSLTITYSSCLLGRFDKLLFVGPLSEVDRQLFITQRMNQLMKNNECIIVSQEILQLTNGFTGADMTLLMQKLLIQVHSKVNNLLLQDEINNILIKILKEGQIKRSVTEKELLMYNRWQSSACIY